MSNPNPQPVAFAAYEAPTLTVTMTPATDITGQNFQLNVRRRGDGAIAIQSTTFNVVDVVNGVFNFPLSSAQTGVTMGVGDYDYDVWRIDAGFEKRLTWGTMTVEVEQWK